MLKAVACAGVLLLSVFLAGLPPDSYAASAPTVKIKPSGMGAIFEVKNPKNASPIYAVFIGTDGTVLSETLPKGWTAEVTVDLRGETGDSIYAKTSSNPILAGKAASFTVKTSQMLMNANWGTYNASEQLVWEGTVVNPLKKMMDLLIASDEHSYLASVGISELDLDSAEEEADITKDLLFSARKEYKLVKSQLLKSDRTSVEKMMLLDERLLSLYYRAAFMYEKYLDLLDRFEYSDTVDDEYFGLVREYELLAYDNQEISADFKTYASDLSKSLRNKTVKWMYDYRGYDMPAHVSWAKETGIFYGNQSNEMLLFVDDVYKQFPVIDNFEDSEIPADYEVVSAAKEMIPATLVQFFDRFDEDGDGEIDLSEGQAFYHWVEENIVYRYDDEYEAEPLQGSLVGDGRSGPHYTQTPYETFTERAGDCEDTATLEEAFYNYFGISSYVVGVNAVARDAVDHAATIVLIGGTVEEFQDLLGSLTYYEIPDNSYDVLGDRVAPGVYMLVDNAYSDGYGYLSDGLEEGKFKIACYIPLGTTIEETGNACSVPFD